MSNLGFPNECHLQTPQYFIQWHSVWYQTYHCRDHRLYGLITLKNGPLSCFSFFHLMMKISLVTMQYLSPVYLCGQNWPLLPQQSLPCIIIRYFIFYQFNAIHQFLGCSSITPKGKKVNQKFLVASWLIVLGCNKL